jgi:hypothetical protein
LLAGLDEAPRPVKRQRGRVGRLDVDLAGDERNAVSDRTPLQIVVEARGDAPSSMGCVDDDAVDVAEPIVAGAKPGEVGVVVAGVFSES